MKPFSLILPWLLFAVAWRLHAHTARSLWLLCKRQTSLTPKVPNTASSSNHYIMKFFPSLYYFWPYSVCFQHYHVLLSTWVVTLAFLQAQHSMQTWNLRHEILCNACLAMARKSESKVYLWETPPLNFRIFGNNHRDILLLPKIK